MAKKDLQKTKKSVKEEKKKKKEKRHGRGSPHKERVKKAQEILDLMHNRYFKSIY